jgi:hypothetical protein
MNKIVLINCYFGKFPWYFNFFIKSCELNRTVNFIIFSDSIYDKYLPQNVEIIPFKLSDFNLLATEKLEFRINVINPYKLCDFKPAYGLIFAEYIRNYSFWGICDIDIILGRIREFVTDDLLDEYDIINTRHDYLTGSFLLFRNTDFINKLFLKSKDYKKVFTSEKHYCFDECNFKHIEMEQGISIFDVNCEIESMEHIVRKEMEIGTVNVFFDFLVVDGLCGKLKWDSGILGYDKKFEVLLFHLIQYKSNLLTRKTTWVDIPNGFYIDKYTFRKKEKTNLFGLLCFLFYDIVKPFIFKVSHYFEYFISVKFRPNMVTKIETGIFKNKLGSTILDIQQDHEGNNIVVNYFMSKSQTKLIKSKLNKRAFYFKGFAFQKCLAIVNRNALEMTIQRNESDGNISHFERINCSQKHKDI